MPDVRLHRFEVRGAMAISLVLMLWAGIIVSGSAGAQQDLLPPLTVPTLLSSSTSSSATTTTTTPTTTTTTTTTTTVDAISTVDASTTTAQLEEASTTTVSLVVAEPTETAGPGGGSTTTGGGPPALAAEARPLLPSMSPPVAPPEIDDPDVLAEELTLMTQPARTHRMPISRAVEQSRLWWDGLVKMWFGLPLWWQGALGTGLALLLVVGGARSATRLITIGQQLRERVSGQESSGLADSDANALFGPPEEISDGSQ